MLTDFEKGVICLVRSGLTNKKAELPENFDIEKLYSVAKQHQIRILMLCGVAASDFDREHPAIKQLSKGAYHEILISEKQLAKYRKTVEEFEKNGIDYMPLKGILLKDIYPQMEMRSMGDIDILTRFEQYDKVQSVLSKLNFEHIVESDHEHIWQTADGVTLELHKHLIPSYNKDYYPYFGDGWNRAKKVSEDKHMYRMTPEDEFIYLFVHFSKHYRDGGIGIKHFTDLWVYINQVSLDQEYIITELKKIKLEDFYQNICSTMKMWFADGEGDEKTELISSTIISSGAYGKRERNVLAAELRKKLEKKQTSKFKNYMSKLFLPYENMCKKYPYLKKYPLLLPIAHIIRITDAVCNKQDRIAMYANDINIVTPERVEEYHRQLQLVGLDISN